MNGRSVTGPGKCEKLFSVTIQPENTFFCFIIKSNFYAPLVNNLQVSPLQEAAHFGLSCQDCLHQLSGDLLFLLIRQRHVPFLKPELALSTEQKHELHLKQRHGEKQKTTEELWNTMRDEGKEWVLSNIHTKIHKAFRREHPTTCMQRQTQALEVKKILTS